MGPPRMMLHLAYTRHLPITTVENVRSEEPKELKNSIVLEQQREPLYPLMFLM